LLDSQAAIGWYFGVIAEKAYPRGGRSP